MTLNNPFKLKKVCADCPFRNDRYFPMRVERAQEIVDALKMGMRFTCHKTIIYGEDEEGRETHGGEKQQFCAGALATIIKGKHANTVVQVADRLGIRDPDEFDHDAQPVYDSLDEWVRSKAKEDRGEA